ncbi:rod shape-determining protein MreC [Streptomyces sp. DvalAA-14]|uniref:rod shape-determining protein MreC n=1 Tax=unclassified Streptomyces TaxID=2593676 RepID=UPI00081B3E7C|nr:rod shape-determining protein MreC [Streptomyces sp. DvalAA-14]MYS24757.1 rod shape-determining protein MreC [Streptomyces sp. SID4948]SCE49050.1 rod shape-determining protein MreC [Streptomyces sp. DvalAA-14]
MRDTKESRLLLVLLVVMAFALITVDIRGGENSPLDRPRQVAQSVFGPVENSVAGVVDPVGNAVDAVRDSGGRSATIHRLQRENEALKQQLGSKDMTRNRAAELDSMLKTAGAGQYTIKGAQVIAIGAAQGFSWTVTIDAGSKDGITRDMTVINGDGLVGRVTTVGPSTATVLLANDPDFTVGTRLEKTMELGFATGEGNRPMRVQLLNSTANVHNGDRLVTFGSTGGKPFVAGVPVGRIVRVDPAAGNLTKTVQVQPFVSFTKLDIVGVVVVGPRTDPRDSVLPTRPAPPATAKPKPKTSPSGTAPGTNGDQPSGTSNDPSSGTSNDSSSGTSDNASSDLPSDNPSGLPTDGASPSATVQDYNLTVGRESTTPTNTSGG